MSIRSWLYAFALGLTLSTSGQAWGQSAGDNKPRQEDGTSDANYDYQSQDAKTLDFSPALKNIEAAIRDLVTEEDQIEAQRNQDIQQRDLRAQEDMAKWAFWMTFATIGGVMATFLGLYFLFKTLNYTRIAAEHTEDMLKETKNATKAAEEAVIATRDIGEKQIRAYLSIQNMIMIFDPASNGNGHLRIDLRNSGASPALDIECYLTIEVRNDTLGKAQNFEIAPCFYPDVSSGSQSERVYPLNGIPDVFEAGTFINLSLRMQYRTVFDHNKEQFTVMGGQRLDNVTTENALFKVIIPFVVVSRGKD